MSKPRYFYRLRQPDGTYDGTTYGTRKAAVAEATRQASAITKRDHCNLGVSRGVELSCVTAWDGDTPLIWLIGRHEAA